jgi:hypothetical protein
MVVASCRSIFILSDVVYNHTFVSFRFSVRDLNAIRGKRMRAVGCRPDPARPVAWPTSAPPRRAPSPHPMCVPSPLSLSLFPSRAVTSLSSTSPCPRWDSGERLPPIVEPRGEFPSPLLSPYSPSLSLRTALPGDPQRGGPRRGQPPARPCPRAQP